eukprot:1046533-Rhodomonas_salina.2
MSTIKRHYRPSLLFRVQHSAHHSLFASFPSSARFSQAKHKLPDFAFMRAKCDDVEDTLKSCDTLGHDCRPCVA